MADSFSITEGIDVEGTPILPGKLVMSDGTNTLTVQAPVGMTSSYTMSLPINLGSLGDILSMTSPSSSGWITTNDTTKLWYVLDAKPSGTNGGPIQPATWVTRDLNTISQSTAADTSIQLAVAPAGTNQLLVQAGSYKIYGVVPYYRTRGHRSSLFNVTDNTRIMYGTTAYINLRNTTMPSILMGVIDIASQKVLEIQTYAPTSTNTSTDGGRSVGASGGFNEWYTQLMIEKLG